VLHLLEATLGGTRRYLGNILVAGRARAFKMGLAYATSRSDSTFGSLLREIQAAGWDTFPVHMRREIRPWSDARAVFSLRRVIQVFRPDIIHCHSSKAGGVGRLAVLSLVPRPRVVYSPHAVAAHLGRRYLLLERLLTPLTDRFVAVSDSERRELIQLRVAPADRVEVVYPVVEIDRYTPRDQAEARRLLGIAARRPLVVGIGRLVPQKDPLSFLRVITLVRQQIPSVFGLWLGDGELRREMERAIHAASLADTVSLAGWQPDVRAYIAASDVVLSTSRYESFGYVVAEALAMERPVVATAVAGVRDVLVGELAALQNPPGAEAAAAARVISLLENTELARRLSGIGRRLVAARFSEEQMGSRLEAVYASVLQPSTRYRDTR